MILVSIYDKKACYFRAPLVVHNESEARHAVCDLVRNSGNLLNLHPDDFALYKLASFEEVSGVVTSVKPEFICELSEYRVTNV